MFNIVNTQGKVFDELRKSVYIV